MAELPIDLQQLEPVRGAWDILTYLLDANEHAADGDDIMDDLDMSSRGFDKAKRRLVTRSYIQMRSDYFYELTRKGIESAQVLAEYLGKEAEKTAGTIERQAVIALPRNLVYGQTSPIKIGFEPSSGFNSADIIMRLSGINADLGDYDEMASLDSGAFVVETTITPHAFDQARVKLEVYQSSGGDVNSCGGMYVDVVVLASGDTGDTFGYGVDLRFDQ